MPNWNSNNVTITGATTEQVQRIIAACENDNLLHEFYPEPDWANTPNEDGVYPSPHYKSKWLRTQTHEGKQIWRCQVHVDSRRFPDGSADQRWYGWRSSDEGWGTKWDVSETHVEQQDNGELLISFMTAWCPPGDLWFEKLSEAMPNAEIVNNFSEPGCDFAGVQFASGGVCLSKCIEISPLFNTWVEKQLSPEQLLVYKDEDHADHEELYEDLRDHWYDAQDDVIDEELSSFMNALPDKVSA